MQAPDDSPRQCKDDNVKRKFCTCLGKIHGRDMYHGPRLVMVPVHRNGPGLKQGRKEKSKCPGEHHSAYDIGDNTEFFGWKYTTIEQQNRYLNDRNCGYVGKIRSKDDLA